ncbi:MAG TPA: hypothetical protein VLQ93_10005, partial [Myxococcaceae bacterium]|nr:hypothetical protein [Myxococcaceae bacterium]
MRTRPTVLLNLLALLAATGCGAGLDAEAPLEFKETRHALRAVLEDDTPVTQQDCASTQVTPFARISRYEQMTLSDAADLFNAYQTGPVTPAAGCVVEPGHASCSAFGYVCWVQVLEGGPGEPDVLDYGCGKETC